MSDQAELDIVINAPGTASVDAATASVKNLSTAVRENAPLVDANRAAYDQWRESADGLTAGQRALAAAGLVVDEATGKVTRATQAATQATTLDTASRKAATDAMRAQIAQGQSEADAIARSREMILAHAEALAIDDAPTRKMALAQIEAIKINEAMTAGFDASALGSGRVRQGLVSLIAQATGTIPVIDRLGASFLTMGIGGGVTLGVIAGVAAISLGYEYFTKDAREAQKAQDELTKSAEHWASLDLKGVAGERIAQIEAETAKLKTLTDEYVRQQQILATPSHATPAGGSIGVQYGAIGADKNNADRAKADATIAQLEKDLNKQLSTYIDERATIYARDLANAIKYGHASSTEIANAQGILADLTQQLSGPAKNAPLEFKNNLTEMAHALNEALNPEVSANVKAMRDRMKELEIADQQLLIPNTALTNALQKQGTELAQATELANGYAVASDNERRLAGLTGVAHELVAARIKAETDQRAANAKFANDPAALDIVTKEIQSSYDKAKATIQETAATHQAESATALLNAQLTAVDKAGRDNAKTTAEMGDAYATLSKVIGEDLLHAVDQLARGGQISWTNFFHSAESLSAHLVSTIMSDLDKMAAAQRAALAKGQTDQAAQYASDIDDYKNYLKAVKGVGIALGAGSIGYGIGESTGSTAAGLVGGAAGGAASGFATAGPWGAVIGGLAGAAGGLFGAADAQHKAAEAIQNAAATLRPEIANYINPNPTAQALSNNDAQFTALLTALNKIVTDSGGYGAVGGVKGYNDTVDSLYAKKAANDAQVASDFLASLTQGFNALNGPAGQLANELAALDKSYQDNIASINALVQAGAISGSEGLIDEAKASALHEAQVEDAKKVAAEAALESKEDLQVRLQAAQGTAYSVTQMQREVEERRELATSTADNLELTKQVIKAEDDKAAADRVQLIADTQASLKITADRLSGNNAEADALQLAQDQAQRRRDLENQGLFDSSDAANAATISQLAYVEAMEKATLASNQAYDAIEKQVSAIKEEAGVFGYSSKETLDREAQAYHFDGQTRDQIAAQYTIYNGTDLKADQLNTNKEIVEYLNDLDNYNKSLASSAGTANAAATSKVTNQVQSDITGLTEGTGSRMADYLSSEVILARESRDFLQSIDATLSGASGGSRLPFSSPASTNGLGPAAGPTTIDYNGATSITVNISGPITVGAGVSAEFSADQLAKLIQKESGRAAATRSIDALPPTEFLMDSRLAIVGVQGNVAAVLAAAPEHERLTNRCDGWLDLMYSAVVEDGDGLAPELLGKALSDLRALVASSRAQENRVGQLANAVALLDHAVTGNPLT